MSSSTDGLFAGIDARVRAAIGRVAAAADPHPADPFRGLYVTDEAALALAHLGPVSGEFEARLLSVGDRLGLPSLDLAVLALCAAPDLSPHYGRLLGYLHDDVTRRLATPRLAARLLGVGPVGEHHVLACLGREAALRRLGAVRLLDDDPTLPLEERPLRLADRLVGELLGVPLDSGVASARMRRLEAPPHDIGREATVAHVRRLLAARADIPVLLAGPDAPELLAVALGQPLLLTALDDLDDRGRRLDSILASRLEGRRLAFDRLDEVTPNRRAPVLAALAEIESPIICASRREHSIALGDATAAVVEVPAPTFAERRTAWRVLGGCDHVDEVAAKFRLSISDIAAAASVARLAAGARGDARPNAADLDEGARRASRVGLAEVASRLDTLAGWDDLVLPQRQMELLNSICTYLRLRDRVLSEWGYARSVARDQGLKALFAGDSGTGKTLAAQVLSRELGLDLFRVDLATVMSKYIGETEKNLERIFTAAEGSNAVLFFDEADALLGKRSDVSDAHDRYANIEVAYLLQRMETYPGGVVLATNFRQNIDEAFVRRLDFVVDFPFPEEADRARLWRMLLPDAAPVHPDVDIDFLARRFKLSGGAIRNCSVAAAFMAADSGGPIDMGHLVRAVALEYGKLGRLTLEADFDRYHTLVRQPGGNRVAL